MGPTLTVTKDLLEEVLSPGTCKCVCVCVCVCVFARLDALHLESGKVVSYLWVV